MLNKDFKEFVQLLNANEVEYLVVGGYALMAHGHPRYTGDIDFWVSPTPQNIAKLLSSLEQFGFASLGLAVADFEAPDTIIQLGFPPARIDLMVSASGVEFSSAYAARLKVDLNDVCINVINREDFIRNKQATGREKDFLDLKELGVQPSRPDASK
ncbi:MAG: hypothetical protein JWP47_2900 [Polaromonas sp.]|nr:hypothetical protein [Polaromonas sp.]